MSYEPLHHKYRPQTFAHLVGQSSIATTLTNAIALRRIAPAYLFTGPRGTGKTSSARILAKSLNCKQQDQPTASPCGVCEVCKSIASGNALDVIEIDAASNTGVDNIREIIERAQFAPVQCRYKVYVVDECHMLSVAAFNALLKTLEEPPKHVVFVLATTDPQRVLPTIISRCQRFDFRRIPLEEMVNHLGGIAQQENINITPDALTLVAQVAQGGLRDAESLLDQLSLLPGQVTVEAVWDLVGAVPERDLLALCRAIASDNAQTVLEQCRALMDRGREPLVVLQNLAGFYRDLLIAKTAPNRRDLVAVTPPTWTQLCEFAQQQDAAKILFGSQHLKNSEAQVKNTTQPRLWLEVTLLGLLPSALSATNSDTKEDRSPSHSGLKTAISDRPKGASVANRTPQSEQPAYPTTPAKEVSKQEENHSNIASKTSVERSQTHHSPLSQPEQSNLTTSAIDSASPIAQSQAPSAFPQISRDQPETPASVSHSAHREAAPSVTNTEAVRLQEAWQNVVNSIKLRGTRELLRQHCCLLAFNTQQATIGLSSKGLLKLAQTKLPEVEAAFQAVYNTTVRVDLKPVDATTSNKASATVQSYSQEDNGMGNGSKPAVSRELPTPQSIVTEPRPESGVTRLAPNYPVGEQGKSVPSDSSTTQAEGRGQRAEGKPADKGTISLSTDRQQGFESPTSSSDFNSGGVKSPSKVSLLPSASYPLPSLMTVVPVPNEPLLTQELEGELDADDVEKALIDIKQFFEGEIVELTDETRLSEQAISSQPRAETLALIDDATTNQLEPESATDQEKLDTTLTDTTFGNIEVDLGDRNWKYDDDGELEF